MSSTFAGTQEYMAMEKLGQLHARGEWDLIVVDTPPSRSALDFLDAPARLSRFLDGRMLRLLLAPARSGGRSMFSLVTASFGMFSRVVQKVLGAQLLTDLSGFVAALDSMFGGFRQRAEQTYRILQARETAFLLVAAPEPDAVREAAYFAGRLRRGADAAGRAGAQPGAPAGGVRAGRRPSRAWPPRTGWPSWAGTRAPRTCCGCTPRWSGRRHASSRWRPVHRGVPGGADGVGDGAARRRARRRRAADDRRGDQPAVTAISRRR